MYKSFAVLAAVVAGHSRKDIGNLHASLEHMLSAVEAPKPNTDAYRVAKRYRQADIISTANSTVDVNGDGHVGFYNKFTGTYVEECQDQYAYGYSYSTAFRTYYSEYCPGSYNSQTGTYTNGGYYSASADFLYGRGSEYDDMYGYRYINVHEWLIENTTMDEVEQSFNHTMDASDDFADGLVEVSNEIKEANKVTRRKARVAFDTIEETADSVQRIQEEAARQTEAELEEFFQGIANA